MQLAVIVVVLHVEVIVPIHVEITVLLHVVEVVVQLVPLTVQAAV